jgi:hypothetical protein
MNSQFLPAINIKKLTMKNLLIVLSLLLFATTFSFSQNLVRKGWLGVQFENISSDEAAKHNISPPAGSKGAAGVCRINGRSFRIAGGRYHC